MLLAIPFVIILGLFLLTPVTTDEQPIVFDQRAIDRKHVYLEELRARREDVPEDRPNVVLILADDLGKTDISRYGGTTVPTPHMDSIGARGVTFTEATCTSPICAPSRAGLLTGRHQQRFGMETQPMERYAGNRAAYAGAQLYLSEGDWVPVDTLRVPLPEQQRLQGLPPSEITIAEMLQASGYATAAVGKWHLGTDTLFAPRRFGFDYHYGFYEAFSLYAPVDDPSIVNYRHDYFANKHIWRRGRGGSCAIRRNGTEIDEPGYLTFRIAEEAAGFIREHADSSFFLYVPFNAPHTPFQAPRDYVERFSHVDDLNKRVYYAMIAALDDAVGQIVAAIDSAGLSNNTIIIFAGDNGGATYTGATDNAPLKGGKFINFEGGLNVPCMMQWPGHIPPRQTCTTPVSLMDFFTTIANAADCPLPEGVPIDGVDLLPAVAQTPTSLPDRTLFWRTRFQKAARHGPWKLYVDGRRNAEYLYNLATDKEEHINLIATRPGHAAALRRELAAWESRMSPPAWPPVMYYRYVFDGEEFLCPL